MLDIRTMFAMLVLSCLLAGAGVLVMPVPAERRPSAVRWGLGNLAVAAGLMLVGLRDHIPLWISVVVGNSLQFSGLALCCQAVALLAGRRTHDGAAAAGVTACTVALTAMLLFHAPLQHRIILNSAAVATVLAITAATLAHLNVGIVAGARKLMQSFYVIAATVAAVRLSYFLFLHASVASVFDPNPVQVLNFVVYYFTLIGTSVTYLIIQSGLTYNDLAIVANNDMLTGVRNRRNFMDLAERELALAQRTLHPLSVMMLDMDNFKKINDEFGHAAGDDALRRVGEVLRDSLRNVDLIGRYGGEEFSVLQSDTATEVARQSADRIRRGVEASVLLVNGDRVPLTVSIGIASLMPGEHRSLQQLLGAADDALYQAKAMGKNCVSTAPETQPPATDREGAGQS